MILVGQAKHKELNMDKEKKKVGTPAQQVHMCGRCGEMLRIVSRHKRCTEPSRLWHKHGGFQVIVAYCDKFIEVPDHLVEDLKDFKTEEGEQDEA
jgi:hypothetical protein